MTIPIWLLSLIIVVAVLVGGAIVMMVFAHTYNKYGPKF